MSQNMLYVAKESVTEEGNYPPDTDLPPGTGPFPPGVGAVPDYLSFYHIERSDTASFATLKTTLNAERIDEFYLNNKSALVVEGDFTAATMDIADLYTYVDGEGADFDIGATYNSNDPGAEDYTGAMTLSTIKVYQDNPNGTEVEVSARAQNNVVTFDKFVIAGQTELANEENITNIEEDTDGDFWYVVGIEGSYSFNNTGGDDVTVTVVLNAVFDTDSIVPALVTDLATEDVTAQSSATTTGVLSAKLMIKKSWVDGLNAVDSSGVQVKFFWSAQFNDTSNAINGPIIVIHKDSNVFRFAGGAVDDITNWSTKNIARCGFYIDDPATKIATSLWLLYNRWTGSEGFYVYHTHGLPWDWGDILDLTPDFTVTTGTQLDITSLIEALPSTNPLYVWIVAKRDTDASFTSPGLDITDRIQLEADSTVVTFDDIDYDVALQLDGTDGADPEDWQIVEYTGK